MLHFRALILYTCFCTRQTERDTAVFAAATTAERMIRKEKKRKGNTETATKNCAIEVKFCHEIYIF